MSRQTVLARVEDDLALGDYERAKNRLRTLVEQCPVDLDLRERLAAVHRRAGNPVEAGRWSFLGDQLEREQLAFRRAFPHPWQQLRALRWRGQPEDAPSPASERLRALAAAIEELAEAEVVWHDNGSPTDYRAEAPGWIGGAVAIVLALSALALIGIGLVTVARWIL